ncbi:hypothetical protein V5T82_10940 [Magnetovibrio sp. PR-2]|uniref:hypothetical protein n=1 Tax=Magnetovibrio sp. PR-2 TaxID=3120356 RepID=UPI002FCDEE73
MAHIKTYKTSFTAGEVSLELAGRGDLKAYDNGASNLSNIFVMPTGGLRRRAGLRYAETVETEGRLVAFEFNTEQTYLLVFREAKVDVFENDTKLTTIDPAPWTLQQAKEFYWVQSADTLYVTHPDIPPKELTRDGDGNWSIADLTFYTKDDIIYQPYHKFADDEITLQPSGTAKGATINLTASADVFVAEHVGKRLRVEGKELEVTTFTDATHVQAIVREALINTTATTEWEEQAFSEVRGWPVTVCFHQDRLVIGGSRDSPNRLWMSKSADIYNFDLGTGLDDESIEFAILSDQVNAIRAVFSGRHLQVFTSGAEWMVSGSPLTPSSIQLNRQTRVGSPIDRSIPPVDVDGSTLYVSRAEDELREFLFTDLEQAYQSGDLAILSRHMVSRPINQDYDKQRRQLHAVMADGTISSLTVYRREKVTAWSRQQTDGKIVSLAVVGTDVYVLVERNETYLLEVFDDDYNLDAALKGSDETGKATWSGLDHLEGLSVKVVGDGAVLGDFTVSGGSVTLEAPVQNVEMGLGYTHIIEPLPLTIATDSSSTQGGTFRPISFSFRLRDTPALRLDVGSGYYIVPFKRFGPVVFDAPPEPFSGDKKVRALGWRKDAIAPLWRIEQDTPLPFTLLSVVSEVSLNG